MATDLERYEILKRHLPEEAARVIAEAFPIAEQVVTKDYLDARLETALRRLETSLLREIQSATSSLHREFGSLQRWMLTFMASLWLGLGGMIAAIVVKG